MFQINTTSFLKCCHLTNNIELGFATPAQAWWTAQFLCNFMQTAQPGEKLKVMGEVKGESQSMGPTFSWLIPPVPCQSGIPILSYGFSTFGLVNQRSRSNDHNIAQLQVQTIPQNFKWHKSIQQFQRYGFRKVWPKYCLIWQVFGPWASPYGTNNYDAAQLQV